MQIGTDKENIFNFLALFKKTKSDDAWMTSAGSDDCSEDGKKNCVDVTDGDAEWWSMAPRDRRVIGCGRLLRGQLGAGRPHTAGSGPQLNTPADAPPRRRRPRNNLIINNVSVWPTNRRRMEPWFDWCATHSVCFCYWIPSSSIAKPPFVRLITNNTLN